jgi:hypothetical protein
MLSSALGWYIGDGSFEHFEQSLLNTFSGYISGDRNILAGFANLIDLVDVEDATLCGIDIEVRCVEKLQKKVFDILSNISSLRQSRCISDGKRNIEHLGQGPGHERLATPSGSNKKDV